MRVDTLGAIISGRLVLIAPDATLRTAASALSAPHIGLVVVCDDNKKAVGVVSKSDIICHLTQVGLAEVPIMMLMSRDIVSCCPGDDLYDTWRRMASQGRQNIPVLSTGVPVGVLDIRDALNALLNQEEQQEQLLFNYVAGVGYQ